MLGQPHDGVHSGAGVCGWQGGGQQGRAEAALNGPTGARDRGREGARCGHGFVRVAQQAAWAMKTAGPRKEAGLDRHDSLPRDSLPCRVGQWVPSCVFKNGPTDQSCRGVNPGARVPVSSEHDPPPRLGCALPWD